jgi:uncharacterized protein (TIGR02145 family)
MKTLQSITITVLLTFGTLTTAQTKKTVTKTATKPSTQTIYSSVKIGEQEWMSKNLDVSTFRNGDPIPRAQSAAEWAKASKAHKPAWCYYSEKSGKYGKLYNWYAVNDKRGLAPRGWHIPNSDEWEKLIDRFYSDFEGDYLGAVKSNSGWESDIFTNRSKNGTNSNGFNALPGGNRQESGRLDGIGQLFKYWTASPGCQHQINYHPSVFNRETEALCALDTGGSSQWGESIQLFSSDYGIGASVKCVKDESNEAKLFYEKAIKEENESNNYEGAVNYMSNAINIDGNNYIYFSKRGYYKLQLGNYEDSLKDLKKGKELVEKYNLNDDVEAVHLLYYLGSCYRFLGDKEQGCFYLNKAANYGMNWATEAVQKYCD